MSSNYCSFGVCSTFFKRKIDTAIFFTATPVQSAAVRLILRLPEVCHPATTAQFFGKYLPLERHGPTASLPPAAAFLSSHLIWSIFFPV